MTNTRLSLIQNICESLELERLQINENNACNDISEIVNSETVVTSEQEFELQELNF